MKVNLKQLLRDFDGEILEKPVRTDEKDAQGNSIIGKKKMDLRTICIDALQAVYQDEKNLDPEEKMKRFVMAEEIYLADGEMELKDDQVVFLKKMVNKAFPSPLVYGQVTRILEGQDPIKKKQKTKP